MALSIGIVSDTHGLLRPEVISRLSACDAILHAGDIGSLDILNQLKAVAPVYAVRGNNDGAWAADLPLLLPLTMGGVCFLMTHDRRDLPRNLGEAQVIIFGHSHRYGAESVDGRLWLNPGSCGRRRFRLDITFAVMCVEAGAWRLERITLA